MNELESHFDFNELFFSTTNERGIITSFNDTFVRVSEFDTNFLRNKPHNIIRHPDMPKAIFRLLWKEISEKRSIVAYVKNKSKNNKFYWVTAMVFPINSGFLSIRLKPSSTFFPIIQELYTKIKALEKTGASDTEVDSSIVKALDSLGFSEYRQFMEAALTAELESRDHILDKLVSNKNRKTSLIENTQNHFSKAFKLGSELQNNSKAIEKFTNNFSSIWRSVSFLTTNMTISADKLGKTGDTLSVISSKFNEMAKEIYVKINNFKNEFSIFNSLLKTVIFDLSASRFQIEMINQFIVNVEQCFHDSKEEQISCLDEFRINFKNLFTLLLKNITKLDLSLTDFSIQFQKLNSALIVLSEVISGMNIVRVSGKIEVSHLTQQQDEFTNHTKKMEAITIDFHDNLKQLEIESKKILDAFKEISDISTIIQNNFSSIEFEVEEKIKNQLEVK